MIVSNCSERRTKVGSSVPFFDGSTNGSFFCMEKIRDILDLDIYVVNDRQFVDHPVESSEQKCVRYKRVKILARTYKISQANFTHEK